MDDDRFIGSAVPHNDIWETIITEWRNLMNRYIERYNIGESDKERKDLPYWWEHEAANGGILAGAVWSLEGSVIEQWGIERDNGKGKCDLWIGLGSLECAIEYKRINPQKLSEETTKQIEYELNNAKAQLKSIKEPVGNRFAVCFVAPCIKDSYISAFNETKRIFNSVRECFSGERNIIDHYFPQGNVQTEDLKEGSYYPGVTLVGELLM